MIKTETCIFIYKTKTVMKQVKRYLALLDTLNDENIAGDIPDAVMELLTEIGTSSAEIKVLSDRLWLKWRKEEEKNEII